MADRSRGVRVHAAGLGLENPAALIYAPHSCGGEPAGDRAGLARYLRADLAERSIDRRERAIIARDRRRCVVDESGGVAPEPVSSVALAAAL